MSIDDERVRFYFRNRMQIEEWAALRTEAAMAVDEWLEQLGPELSDLADQLGSDVRLCTRIDKEQALPSFRLYRLAWPTNADDDLVCIALEWVRYQTTMRKGFTPYVGVRAPKGHPFGQALRSSEQLKQVRLTRKDNHSPASTSWPAYGYVVPPADFPVSTDSYRTDLIEALRIAWTAYEPIVTSVLAAAAASAASATAQPATSST